MATNTNKAESASRITKDQIERLIQIMEQSPDVAKRICVNPASFWHEANMELNSLGPAKDKYSWKKVKFKTSHTILYTFCVKICIYCFILQTCVGIKSEREKFSEIRESEKY